MNCFIEINFECQPEFFLWWLFHNWHSQKGLFEKLSLEPSTPILKVFWKCNSKLINPFTPKTSLVILLTVCHIILDVGWKNLIFDQLTIPKLMFLYFYHFSAGYCNDIVTRISVLSSHLWSFTILSFQHLTLFSKCSSFTHFYRCIHFLVPASGKHGLWGSRHSSSPSLTQEILFSS